MPQDFSVDSFSSDFADNGCFRFCQIDEVMFFLFFCYQVRCGFVGGTVAPSSRKLTLYSFRYSPGVLLKCLRNILEKYEASPREMEAAIAAVDMEVSRSSLAASVILRSWTNCAGVWPKYFDQCRKRVLCDIPCFLASSEKSG